MRSIFLAATLFALLFPCMVHAQKGKKVQVEIFSDVLKTAEWAAFKYMDNIYLAQSGDQKAIKALLEFSATLDGVETLQHATTCIELIPIIKDDKFGSIVSILKPKLKTALLDRFQLAQARTKKEELRKPFQEWAPLTWKALNGEKVACSSCMSQGTVTKPGAQKPTPSSGLEVTTPVISSEKQ